MPALFALFTLIAGPAVAAPDCSRPLSLALHEHGLLYSSQTGEGIDKDIADELARRSGCTISVSLMPRARIWQLIESGGLDFSLSGISNEARLRFASFAWYFSNHYYLLVANSASRLSMRRKMQMVSTIRRAAIWKKRLLSAKTISKSLTPENTTVA